MYLMYLMKEIFRTALLCMILALFLRQVLPLFGKRPGVAEQTVMRCTRVLWLVGEYFCQMMGVSLSDAGIDMRYPMATGILALAWLAVSAW